MKEIRDAKFDVLTVGDDLDSNGWYRKLSDDEKQKFVKAIASNDPDAWLEFIGMTRDEVEKGG